ncbi:MAG: DUF3082 domain-containing protein [Oscillatoriales cyanobacterium RM2_1_1]|nr:DUF3082 domain-containing protein [Oscillatoriales cyanobacterium SM2_3_0]NJO45171.1 DUF3082 domain-containing protein [Oscillatoriales cyanobacterium RM2_1_1]
MNDSPHSPDLSPSSRPNPTPWQCFSNGAVLGAIATALFLLTRSVAQVYAHKQIYSNSLIAARLSVAVKTLVVGLCMLGTAVFGFIAAGLIVLGTKLLIQQWLQPGSQDEGT